MTTLTFRYIPAAGESVDPQFDLLADGSATGIYIQDCRSYGGGFSISECGNEGTEDSFWTREIATAKGIEAARKIATQYYNTNYAN
jgi:hypothetical protein